MDKETRGYQGARDSLSHEPIKRMLTEKEAASYLGVSIDTLRRMRYSGKLDYVPIGPTGRGIRYDLEDLGLWITKSKMREPQ